MGYRGKLEERERARELRAQAWTLAEIAEELGVSRSSASLWCRAVPVDDEALARRRRERFLHGNEGARQRGPNELQRRKHEEIEGLREEGRRRIGRLSEREFLVAGLMLYAGEGFKTPGTVGVANNDPRLIQFFLEWLRHFYDIDERRLRVRLYLHEELDLDAAIAFWVGLTGVPREQFGKPYRAAAHASIRRTKHVNGCPGVRYCCVRTQRSILGMVDALLCSGALPG
jgi:transcriptional regulator with XRE-family HTH domain